MNRKKIALTATALVLAAVGVFAGIKRVVPSHVYFLTTGGSGLCNEIIASNVSSFFTNTAGTNLQAEIRTQGGKLATLWGTATCISNKVYFKN